MTHRPTYREDHDYHEQPDIAMAGLGVIVMGAALGIAALIVAVLYAPPAQASVMSYSLTGGDCVPAYAARAEALNRDPDAKITHLRGKSLKAVLHALKKTVQLPAGFTHVQLASTKMIRKGQTDYLVAVGPPNVVCNVYLTIGETRDALLRSLYGNRRR